MTRQIQLRRGSAAENDAFTGAVGEITMDTTNNTLRVHDGTTAGGIKLAKQNEIPTIPNIPTNEQMAHASMPSSRYIDLTLGASGSSYTAPADGYIYLCKTATAVNQNITIINDSNGMRVSDSATSSSGWVATYIIVSKGQSIRITYTTGGITNTFKFIYANGAA